MTEPESDTEQNKRAPKEASPKRRPKRRPRSGRPNRGSVDYGATGHQARVLAMQALFEYDQTDHDLDDILNRIEHPAPPTDGAADAQNASESEAEDDEAGAIPPNVARRAVKFVRGVIEHLPDIDPYIAAAAPAFPVTQLAAIDRCVLRLAVYELTVGRDEVPYKVAINEAVEIAKRFGGDNASRFINGVLGTIARTTNASSS